MDTVDWPRCGEIDIMEHLGSHPSMVAAHVHSYGNARDPLTSYKNQPLASLGRDWTSKSSVEGAWHTYAIDYRPGAVTFRFDGRPYFVAAAEDLAAGEEWPFTGTQNYLLLNLAVGGAWGGEPDAGTTFPAVMRISDVTVTG